MLVVGRDSKMSQQTIGSKNEPQKLNLFAKKNLHSLRVLQYNQKNGKLDGKPWKTSPGQTIYGLRTNRIKFFKPFVYKLYVTKVKE